MLGNNSLGPSGLSCLPHVAARAALPPATLANLECADVAPVKFLAVRQLAPICTRLLSAPEFAPHAAALQQDGRIAAGLVRHLAPAFHAAVVSLLLPPEQRSAQHSGWTLSDARCSAAVMSADGMRTGLAAHLAAGGPGLGSNALQLLQPACQLLCGMLLDGLAGAPADQAALHDACWCVLDAVASLLTSAQDSVGSLWLSERAQRVSQLLLQLPTQLVSLLRLRERLSASGRKPRVETARAYAMQATASVLHLLVRLAQPPHDPRLLGGRHASDLPEWQPWCAAASTALRSLPALAELVQQSGGELASAVAVLAVSSFKFASSVAQNMHYQNALLASQAPEATSLGTATYHLHSDCCRAVHWGLHALPAGCYEAALLSALGSALVAAAPVPLWRIGHQTTAPWLGSMAAAQCVAMQVLLPALEHEQQLKATAPTVVDTALQALAAALAACPQATTFGPELPSLLAQLTTASLQVSKQQGRQHRGLCPSTCVCSSCSQLATGDIY